jgi:hypothetical protein
LDESDGTPYIRPIVLSVFAARAPWSVAGPLIGLLIVGLLWVTNRPLGALGGYIELDEWAMRQRSDVAWRTVFVVGVIVGGFVSAIVGSGWHPTMAYGSFDRVLGATVGLKAALLVAAGLFMGLMGILIYERVRARRESAVTRTPWRDGVTVAGL